MFLLTALAFGLFGLATEAHHRRRFGCGPGAGRCRAFRRGAWVLLALAFPAAVLAQGWVFGPVLWSGAVMAGAAVAFLALNFLPAGSAR
ncbi:DUF3325 domain-containing protein [Sphingomonas sp. RP10(2022)]|uniref:DUF3325 domain-containing protein n=1 Tax=Sphingomonas liriopis TaxID=2949094 RepID=A0A9X2HRQ5_9SPHN|nr:DUF3325 family protein [Sphingomonas liriopis]MCP3735257.1 DUF3325 domain-containing protein [Sphingomonas liriopis]